MRLPLNCKVDYLKAFLTKEESQALYHNLIHQYALDKARLTISAGGQMIQTDSFKIMFATEPVLKEKEQWEGIHGKIHPWEGLMKGLREKVENRLGKTFELAMCLYYPDGNFLAPYHFDKQTSGFETTLPSLSLGAVREFAFKANDTEEVYSLDLESGSLLVMGDYSQERYTHSLPKDAECSTGRINITFREPTFL
jgi:alkylated DNA repair dioxygenase AlkB